LSNAAPKAWRERVTELAPFVDGAGGFGGHVARNPAGEAELLEEFLHPLFVLADLVVDFAIGPLHICVGHDGGPAVPGADHIDHVEVAGFDHPVQMSVNEIQARRGSPVAQESGFHVLALERLLEEGVIQ